MLILVYYTDITLLIIAFYVSTVYFFWKIEHIPMFIAYLTQLEFLVAFRNSLKSY